jgi:Flp pilus assembly protein TadB
MLAAILVFILVAASVYGAFLAFGRLPGYLAARRLDNRLRDVSAGPAEAAATPDSTLVKRVIEGPLPALERLVVRGKPGANLERLIEQSGVRTTTSAVLIGCAAVGALAAGVAALTIAHRAAVLASGAVACALPILWLTHRRTVRFKMFEEQFP